MPSCRLELHESETETDDPTLIGENCHIVAESDDGPRADKTMSLDRRNSYANLILLCRNHHKIIDAQEGEYTVERLNRMKSEHETWVSEQLGFDAAKLIDDEQYAGMIDKWERLGHINEWLDWSSHVMSHDQPSMWGKMDRDLEELRDWLLNRVWPGRYSDLEDAFENFRQVLMDFQEHLRRHAEPWGDADDLMTQKFYKIGTWDEKRYAHLFKQYEFHVGLVQDLMLELSRAANLISDQVRQHLMRGYRLDEGRFVIMYGPTMNENGTAWPQVVVQYDPEARDRRSPYPGLQAFLAEREQRDFHFGKGMMP